MSHSLSELLEFCNTDVQCQTLEAVISHGSNKKAAEALGKNRRSVDTTISRIKANANKYYEPGFEIERKTIGIKNEDGTRSWIKVKAVKDEVDLIKGALDNYSPKPFPSVKKPQKKSNDEFLDLFTITDFHFGMLAWEPECGDSWDIKIAEKTFANAIYDMVAKAKIRQNSSTAFLNIQGDFLHWDQLEAVTNQSGNILDADTRTSKMIEVVMNSTDWAVLELLKNYKNVKVLICEGNHDEVGSIWLSQHIKKLFAKNKRVEVIDFKLPYYAILHGEIMLCFHHGHKVKNASLQKLFSAEPRFRPMWGAASIAYIHTGHYHHTEKTVDEPGGAIIERHPTLASPDAYAVRGGYISKRGAHAITYDKTLGEVDRSTVYPRA